MTDFSVIIPSRSIDNLVPCVERLMMREPDLSDNRLVIVDDGIEWTQEARDLMADCRILPNERIDGKFVFSRAINIGIRSTYHRVPVQLHGQQETFIEGGPKRHVVLLNDDALLETQFGFTLLVKEAEAHRDFGLIGATTNITGQPLQKPMGVGLRTVPHIAFVCVLIPVSTLQTVGLLDTDFDQGYGCDDRAYCEVVARAGMKIGVFDGCYCDHGSLRSTYRGDPKAPGDFSRNFAILMRKFAGHLVTGR